MRSTRAQVRAVSGWTMHPASSVVLVTVCVWIQVACVVLICCGVTAVADLAEIMTRGRPGFLLRCYLGVLTTFVVTHGIAVLLGPRHERRFGLVSVLASLTVVLFTFFLVGSMRILGDRHHLEELRATETLEVAREAELREGWPRALELYEESVLLPPVAIDARLHLAWLLACCPIEELRDPARALELTGEARAMNRDDRYDDHRWRRRQFFRMEAQAAATAAAGDPRHARQYLEMTLRMLETVLTPEEIRGAQRRIAVYREGRPWIGSR